MRSLRQLFFVCAMLLGVALSLTGCGSSSEGGNSASVADQFAPTGSTSTATVGTSVNMTLTADKPTVDVNNGTVLLTVNLKSGSEAIIEQPVTFAVTAGPATITGAKTAPTDNSGNSVTTLTTGDTLTTTNVIIEASTVYNNKTYRTYKTIQLVRGGGVIMFTSSAGAASGGQINQLADVAKGATTGTVVGLLQQISFKVTDSNGNPRVGVPITLSIDNSTGGATSINITNPTVTSDSAGQGIFNVTVIMTTPAVANNTNAASVIYRATTNDTPPVTAFIGGSYSVSATP